jgi:hypothetical protein
MLRVSRKRSRSKTDKVTGEWREGKEELNDLYPSPNRI